MKDRVSYNCQMVVNIGNYESVRISAGLESDVESDETVESAMERIKAVVKKQVEKDVRVISAKKNN